MPDAASPQITYASVPLADLHPWPGNARRGNIPLIKRSLIRFGQYRSVSVQSATMRVMAGNNTVAAARELGWTHLNVELVDVPDAIGEEINVLDNRANDLAVYDLASQLAQIEALADPAEVGYSPDDIAGLLRALEKETGRPKPQNDPDDAPPLPASSPITQPGDLWQLGPHRLLCGDSMQRTTYDKLLEGLPEPDLLLTDPPYGVALGSAAKNAISGDLTQAAIPIAFAICLERLSADGRVYLFGGSNNWGMYNGLFDHHLRMQVRPIVWVKDQFIMRPLGYHSQFEMVYHGWKGKGGGPKFWYGDRKSSDVWQVSRDSRATRVHPTQKPVAVCEIPIHNSCPPGGLILEPFGGSGSTMIAAERTGRRAALIELDPAYCDVILKRYRDHTGVAPVNAATGEEFPGES